jgi:hypothetical protein
MRADFSVSTSEKKQFGRRENKRENLMLDFVY